MKVKERLKEIRSEGIVFEKIILPGIVNNRGQRSIIHYEDGIEFICDMGRQYKRGTSGYKARRKILERLGVPARRLEERIRTDVHIIKIDKTNKFYKFDYPADDYKYLAEKTEVYS